MHGQSLIDVHDRLFMSHILEWFESVHRCVTSVTIKMEIFLSPTDIEKNITGCL